MIIKNDIRIGNIFKCYGITITITKIDPPFVEANMEGRFAIKDLIPIEIDKLILENMGFMRDNILISQLGVKRGFVKNNLILVEPDIMGRWYAAPFGYPINKTIYLNDVQNIFYCLYNRELEINM